MSKSIGDFFINIIPKFDQSKISSGSSAIGGMSKGLLGVAGAIGTAGAGLYNFTSNLAEQNMELQRSAGLLGITADNLLKNRRAFELAGGSAEDYDSLMKNIMMKSEAIQRGEGDFGLAGIKGFNLTAFLDVNKGADYLKKFMETASATDRLDLGNILGLSESQISTLSMGSKEWERINKLAKEHTAITKEQMAISKQRYEQSKNVGYAWQNVKQQVGGEIMGANVGLGKQLEVLLQDKELISTLKELARAISELTGYLVKFLGGAVKTIGKVADSVSTAKASLGIGENADVILSNKRMAEVKQDAENFMKLRKTFSSADSEGGVSFTRQEKMMLRASQEKMKESVSVLERKYNVDIKITGSESDRELADKLNVALKQVFKEAQQGEKRPSGEQ